MGCRSGVKTAESRGKTGFMRFFVINVDEHWVYKSREKRVK